MGVEVELFSPGYPPWRYLCRRRSNIYLESLCEVVTARRGELADIAATPFRKSVEAERVLLADMQTLGFWHSVTNRKYRPLFKTGLNFEVDFYHPDFQVAVEIEKGEVSNVWKNICKFAESPVIRHGVIMVPVIRKGQTGSTEFYQNTLKRLGSLESIFAFVDSVLIIGY
ncbi:MAG: hypothetical protein RIN56_08295 [Sporomusaceae bacterium]|nr:hypothetical protein [Sporomusaceae bacterium]